MKSITDQSIILETDRFLLRPLEEADTESIVQLSEAEPELWRYTVVPVEGREHTIRYVKTALADRLSGTSYPFAVIDKRSGNVVGCTRFYDIQLHNGSAQLGYTWYSKQQQGNGINAHCKFLLLGLAFETLGLERVEFRADLRNKRSIAAMKKIGCVEEGVLRSHIPIADGTRRDSIILSILKDEWPAVKAKLTGLLV